MKNTYKELRDSLTKINDFDNNKVSKTMNIGLYSNKRNPDDYFYKLIDHIESKNLTANTSGNYKECYPFPRHVVLKSTNPSTAQYPEKFLARQKGTDTLRALGVQTPRLAFYTSSSSKDNFSSYEIQERAEGSTLAFFSIKHFEKFFKSASPDKYDTNNPYIDETLQLEKARYNTHMQKLFLTAPMKQKLDFMNQFRILSALRIGYDCHEENILYSKKSGFWFIDIDNVEDITNLDDFEIGRKLSYSYGDDRFLNFMIKNPLSFGSDSGPFAKVAKLYNNLILNQLLNRNNFESLNYNQELLTQFSAKTIPETAEDERYDTCFSNETVKAVYEALKNEDYKSLEEIDFDFRSDGKFLEIIDKDFFISAYENLHTPENIKNEPENLYNSEKDLIDFNDESTM